MNAVERFLMEMMFQIKLMVHGFVYDEQGDVNIVSMVVLIGIAVLLAVVFREQIEKLLESLFNTINQTSNKVISGS